jgi:hypothetical protein
MKENCISLFGPTTPIEVAFEHVSIDGEAPVKAKGVVYIDVLRRKFSFAVESVPNDPEATEIRDRVKERLTEMYRLWCDLENIELVVL